MVAAMLRFAPPAGLAALLTLVAGCAPAAEESVVDEVGPDEARALEEAATMLRERPEDAADTPAEAAKTATP
ncbi:hypothetical protein G7A66_12400 [Altererythrobacter sp. SALINAS58]|uniref:hypothetical protein n=1 Tax=Alteripontixanthobacter muriae TaxID=2705546 RepID=UPI0015774C37|nr:hypothetical protein [Alteripontixanthobacter muriae]NTZ43870.1 hypothetical protein [Alteripontixanthobacter muriae]